MTGLLLAAALLCTAAAVLSSLAVLVATHRPRVALPVLLDLLLAAGLLRLAASASWTAIATAAAIVAVRKLAVSGLGSSPSPRSQPS